MRILLVEDDPACQLSTAMVLQHLGHDVATADGAEEGLARFNCESYDLVVTDNRMPEGRVDGQLAWQAGVNTPLRQATPNLSVGRCQPSYSLSC